MNWLNNLRAKQGTNARQVVITLIAQAIWVALAAISTAMLLFFFGTTDFHKIVASKVTVPAWTILVLAIVVMAVALVFRSITRKASAVRGRVDATTGNLSLLEERSKVEVNSRIIRSTRFGRWPQGEVLKTRTSFRQQLDRMILEEGTDVRRIWNISSLDDITRVREILSKYEGHQNHSIRAYFKLPDHVLPELLVVEHCGASISFPSTRSPLQLDWMIRFRREDLVSVVRDYFDVLWDRATRLLDAGEITRECDLQLREVEESLKRSSET
jgi:hypothetical protein